MKLRHLPLYCILGYGAQCASGETVFTLQASEPTVDRWNYPHNSTLGFRPKGSLFTGLPEDVGGGADRLGQIIVGFDTEALGVPPGEDPASYDVQTLRLTARVANNPALGDPVMRYDPSTDPFDAMLEGGADPDPGPPVELHGVGFRNNVTADSFIEGAPPPGLGQPAISGSPYRGPEGVTAYPLGYDSSAAPRDVTNNPSAGFDSRPWAVGRTDLVNPGDIVPLDTLLTFDIDLSNPGIRRYVQEGLSLGKVFFCLTSLQPATFNGGGGGSFAIFYLKESVEHQLIGNFAPSLDLSYALSPVNDTSPKFTIEFANDQLALCWAARDAGEAFEILASKDLKNWSVIAERSSAGSGPVQYLVPIAPEATKFFSVRRKSP